VGTRRAPVVVHARGNGSPVVLEAAHLEHGAVVEKDGLRGERVERKSVEEHPAGAGHARSAG